jgi:NADH-quinone oxidoreductase subunit K
MTPQAMLTLAAILFSLGLFCVLTRRNAVSILMGVELILNAANVNLVTFASFPRAGGAAPLVEGHIFVVFTVLLAAAEAAVVLAIVLAIFRSMGTVETDGMDTLKE